ncbi:hypothetical protein [Peptacetobacter sp. AB800]|uniref:hypothetical protein n=1 Tax=Peptacetobacter sp. AB800 TaxID=3388428 RepID=UPI0039FD60AB
MKKDYSYILTNTSGKVIGMIPPQYVDFLTRKLDDIDELQLTIPKYIENRITFEKEEYFLYKEILNERVILLNNEAFIIKDIQDKGEDYLVITAFSKEIKLQKIDIKFEEAYVRLFTANLDDNIFSLNDLLYEQTGWRVGYVEENIAYTITTNEDGSINKEENIRWQDSVNTNWYDYLHKTIAEQFNAFIFFNTSNKTINLYSEKNYGERLGLYLAKDQYITEITKKTDSSDITTRLELIGDEEMDIVGATVTGYSFLENFSYYIENREMSDELIDALALYYKMVEIRTPEWNELQKVKLEKQSLLYDKQRDFANIEANIIACDSMIKSYNAVKDSVNEALWVTKKAEYIDQETIYKNEIKKLQDEIALLDEAILNITLLCKKETATDENGKLIFTTTLLDELKEFVSTDTYQEDSFLRVEDFIEAGKLKLEKICRPTNSFSISVINFMARLLDNDFRKHWNGVIGLGDIIILYDKETKHEELIFLTEYTQDFSENELSLTLSNKKKSSDNARDIADLLRDAKYTARSLNAKNYLLMREKYNKL